MKDLILGGDAFSKSSSRLDEFIKKLIVPPIFYYDHSSEYLNSRAVVNLMISSGHLSPSHVDIKSTVSIRSSYSPVRLYNDLCNELEILGISKCHTFYLNKLSTNQINNFISSEYYEKSKALCNFFGLILSYYDQKHAQSLPALDKFKCISVLTNLISPWYHKDIFKDNHTYGRSLFSSGLLPWFINRKTLNEDTYGAPDVNEITRRSKYLLEIEESTNEKIDIKSLIDIPLTIGHLKGICVATSNPIHFNYLYSLLKEYDKSSYPHMLNYYYKKRSLIENKFRLHS